MIKDAQETRIKRGHMTLMKHRDTALYSGVMLMGSSEVADNVPTAYTDGVNKKYGRKFLESIAEESKVRGLILHENLHVALKQVAYGRTMFNENPKLANLAADFVVNDVIVNIRSTLPNSHELLVELPDGGFYDPMFHNWSMRQVFNYLKKNCKDKQRHLFVKPCAQNVCVFCGGIPRYTVSRSLMGSTTTSQSYSSHLAAVEHKQDV
jgi:predicted metal-dependent peptidase